MQTAFFARYEQQAVLYVMEAIELLFAGWFMEQNEERIHFFVTRHGSVCLIK